MHNERNIHFTPKWKEDRPWKFHSLKFQNSFITEKSQKLNNVMSLTINAGIFFADIY